MKKFVRSMMTYLAEALICLLLVSIFFGVFLVILDKQIPSGGGLYSMFGLDAIFSRKDGDPDQKNLKFFRGKDEIDFGERGNLAAILSRVNRTVKGKQAAAIAWQDATDGMSLFDHDAIQTYNRSSARIKFDPKSYIEMGENSLVIIKKLETDLFKNERRSFLVVADGEFRGRFTSSGEESTYLELETPDAMARIKTSPGRQEETDFKVKINPDKTSSFIVYEGEAEFEANGKKVKLGANQMTSVGIDGWPEIPKDLPDPVNLRSPVYDKTFVYRKLPPKITFSWEALPDTLEYFFQLAGDPLFYDLLFGDKTYQTSFDIGSLKDGTYYWRVASVDGKDADIFSRTRKIVLKKDEVPPELNVEFPENTVYRDLVAIKGRTEPENNIYIGNRKVSVDAKGNFVLELKLNHGINVIVVEASDHAGNNTYQTKLINRK